MSRTGTRVIAWTVVFASTAVMAGAGWITTLPGAERLGDHAYFVGVVGGGSLEWELAGAILIMLRPRNVLGWLFLGAGASSVLQIGLAAYGGYGVVLAEPSWPGADIAAAASTGLWSPAVLAAPTVVMAYYPDGRLASRWWRLPVAGVALAVTLFILVVPFHPPAYDDIAPGHHPPAALPEAVVVALLLGVCVPALVLSTVAIWAGTAVRLARAEPPERQQLAWFVCAAGPLLALTFLDLPRPALAVGVYLVPVVVAVGVLRYRLLGIETVLRRGLVYAALTGLVVVVYLLATMLAGSALDRRPLPGVLAALLVAVALAPVRARLQRAADRLVYGARRDPLSALTRLRDQVAAAGETDLLPAALDAVTGAVRAPGAEVTAPDGRVLGARGRTPAIGGHTVPLRVAGHTVGALRIARRNPGDDYSRADIRLLTAMAAQIAVLVRALHLAEALQRERDRVVAATHTERDRLRRDLHDGLGPSLSGMALGLQAASTALDLGDLGGCRPLLARIGDEVGTAVTEIRRIIDGLRPTVLDALGLAEAVRKHLGTVSPALSVEARIGELPPLPPDVETAAYRIVTEAVTNAARHSAARACTVTVAARGAVLRISVGDDGDGIAPDATAGVGLASMRRRANAQGGELVVESAPHGTVVTVTLPLGNPGSPKPPDRPEPFRFPAPPRPPGSSGTPGTRGAPGVRRGAEDPERPETPDRPDPPPPSQEP
ncbi:ATP-binding protein [Streptomyces sp. NPDC051018]|uniref:sensor histidine kinase n=1 Tax=Streptomyces sp. NPDC051018 TaxID=3365639 RepID=UPI00378A5E8D